MLKSVSVSNFKAFEEKVTLDFSSLGNYDFNKDAVKNGIVKTSIMYGKNAGGKSSFALAIFDIVSNLTDNFRNPTKYLNYLNLMGNEKYATFEFHFIFFNKEVVYIYKKRNNESLIAETLIVDGNKLIDYDKSIKEKEILIKIKGAQNYKVNIDNLHISLLKLIVANCVLEDNEENNAFMAMVKYVNGMLLFWSLKENGFVGYSPESNANIIEEIGRNNHFEDLKKFFKDAGCEEELSCSDDGRRLYIKYKNEGVNFSAAASTGMVSLLLTYYWLEDINNKDKCPTFICVDEFDAFYHFELSRFIVERLKNSDCQVLLTTHNTSLLTNDLLRPDCFYICTKDKIVNLNNATDKELREGHNLEKLYRGGTFGL